MTRRGTIHFQTPEETAATVRQYRVQHQHTQASLAAMLGVTVATVAAWENGRSRPPLYLEAALVELARRLAASRAKAAEQASGRLEGWADEYPAQEG